MIIEVTQQDIDNGQPSRPDCCPVALAIGRKLPECDIKVIVRVVHVRGPDRTLNRQCPLPKQVQQFIVNFDDRRSVQPFTFDLDVIL